VSRPQSIRDVTLALTQSRRLGRLTRSRPIPGGCPRNCSGSVGVEVKELESAEFEILLVEILVMTMKNKGER